MTVWSKYSKHFNNFSRYFFTKISFVLAKNYLGTVFIKNKYFWSLKIVRKVFNPNVVEGVYGNLNGIRLCYVMLSYLELCYVMLSYVELR